MAGTIPLSMTQQFDEFGQPLSGGKLFLIQVGTVSTPQNGFQDTALTLPLPNPITLDAAGRIPQFFLADGSIKVRLEDKNGIVQLASDSVLVIGPSAGGGGGTTVDPTTLIQMGNIIARYGVGALAGYVRLNNLTIGSATSGASERANADTQALFNYLWNADPALTVSGGRGATSAADWTANKQLTLPDWRGYALGALDDMGNSPAGRLTAAFFGSSPIVLGAVGGKETGALTNINQVPQHQHPVFLKDPGHFHIYVAPDNAAYQYYQSGSQGNVPAAKNTDVRLTGITIGSVSGVANDNLTAMQGAITPSSFAAIGPRKLCTFYIKL